jgi:hypothetical protein
MKASPHSLSKRIAADWSPWSPVRHKIAAAAMIEHRRKGRVLLRHTSDFTCDFCSDLESAAASEAPRFISRPEPGQPRFNVPNYKAEPIQEARNLFRFTPERAIERKLKNEQR